MQNNMHTCMHTLINAQLLYDDMKNEWTSLRIRRHTKESIDGYKKEGESYDELINRFVAIAETKEKEPLLFYEREKAANSLERIKIRNIRGGKLYLEDHSRSYWIERDITTQVPENTDLKKVEFSFMNISLKVEKKYRKISGKVSADDWSLKINRKFEANKLESYDSFDFRIGYGDEDKINLIEFWAR